MKDYIGHVYSYSVPQAQLVLNKWWRNTSTQEIFFKYLFTCVFMYVYAYIWCEGVHACVYTEAKRRCQIPQNWTKRCFLGAQLGFGDPNSGSHDCPENAFNHWLVFSVLAAKTLTSLHLLLRTQETIWTLSCPQQILTKCNSHLLSPGPGLCCLCTPCVGPYWICGAHWKCLDG